MTSPTPPTTPAAILLASGSQARAAMLRAAGVPFQAVAPRIDEAGLRDALLAEGASPLDVADALAEAKARRVAQSRAGALVVGSDQVLEHEGALLSKPETREAAVERLRRLSGGAHRLISAAVAYEDGRPVWRHVEEVRVLMRAPSETWLAAYVDRHWEALRESPGAYLLEGEGARMMARIEGDWFAALGLPLLPLLGWLVARGSLEG